MVRLLFNIIVTTRLRAATAPQHKKAGHRYYRHAGRYQCCHHRGLLLSASQHTTAITVTRRRRMLRALYAISTDALLLYTVSLIMLRLPRYQRLTHCNMNITMVITLAGEQLSIAVKPLWREELMAMPWLPLLLRAGSEEREAMREILRYLRLSMFIDTVKNKEDRR